MLRYSLRTRQEEKRYKEIGLEMVYFSNDGLFLSGLTTDDTLTDGQLVHIEYNGTVFGDLQTSVLPISIDGEYTDENYTYEIDTIINSDGILVSGISYDDGCFHPVIFSGEAGETQVIDIYGETFEVEGDSVNIPRTYYVEDGKITLSGITYEVDTTIPGPTTVSILEPNGFTYVDLEVSIYSQKEKQNYKKVVINQVPDEELKLDDIHYASLFKYIDAGLSIKNEDLQIANSFDNLIFFEQPVDGPHEDVITLRYGDEVYSAYTNDESITISGITYPIRGMWRNAKCDNNYVNFYTERRDVVWNRWDKVEVKFNEGAGEEVDVQTTKYIIYDDMIVEEYGNVTYVSGDSESGDVITKSIFHGGFGDNDMWFVESGNNESVALYFMGDEGTYPGELVSVATRCVDINEDGYVYEYYFHDETVRHSGITSFPSETEHNGITYTAYTISAPTSAFSYVEFNGNQYSVSDDTVKFICFEPDSSNTKVYNLRNYNKQYFELTYLKDTEDGDGKYYSYVDRGVTNIVKIDSDGTISRYSYEREYFSDWSAYNVSIEDRNYIIYNNERKYVISGAGWGYKVEEEPETIELEKDHLFVILNEREKYEMDFDALVGASCVRCYTEQRGLPELIINNKHNITVYKKGSAFPLSIVREPIPYGTDGLKVYTIDSFLSFPILLSTEAANNHWQQQAVERDYFDKVKSESINRIVDMEKDMYYPAFKAADETKMVDEIEFKLHFRTRDLSTWTIVDDITSNYEDEEQTPRLVQNCNWNIIDYYYDDLNGFDVEIEPTFEKNDHYTWGYDDNDPDKPLKIVWVTGDTHTSSCEDNTYYAAKITKYSQPADLLYYLNFTDDDVLYHKRKLTKSFLRLLFYDSDDPNTQSLLATSTIYFDDDKLYKHYLENIEPDTHDDYGFVNMVNGEYTEYCGVSREPYYTGADGIWTYNEEFRLDASLIVKNMFESKKTSEGFYLYLFKEYSSNLHERTIYLKIQFNHAGEGKVVNFLVPTEITENEDGTLTYDLLDITNKDKREEFKKGYGLKELYSRLYTKITVKYDETKHKYVYCFPDYMMNPSEPHKVIFNLYEIKIKDESVGETQTNETHTEENIP